MKLGMCIDIVEICFGIDTGTFRQFLIEYLPMTEQWWGMIISHFYFNFISMLNKHWFVMFLFIMWPASVDQSQRAHDVYATSAQRRCNVMTHPVGDQVTCSIPARSGNILSLRLIMKYFLQSFSPFHCFKKAVVIFWQKNVYKYRLTTWRTEPAQEKCG